MARGGFSSELTFENFYLRWVQGNDYKNSQMSVGYSIYNINFWNFWCNFGAKNTKGQLATNLLYKIIVDMTFENFYLVHSPDDRHCLSLYVCVREREIEI